jgi:REP element-mobilizing transposase RayT
MARKWSNLNVPGALHFVTGNTLNRMRVFKRELHCNNFFQVLGDLKRDWPSKVIAYVLMPDHFHLVVNPRDGDIRGFVGVLKSLSAKRLLEHHRSDQFLLKASLPDSVIYEVWQESFKAIPLWSAWMIWQKINYIHANPVKAKLVASAKDYRWSSFRAFYFDSGEPLPVDHDWAWPDDSEKLSKAMKELGWRSYHKRND